MATNLEECPTGILIEFSNTTVSVPCRNGNRIENNLSSKAGSLKRKSNEKEEQQASDIPTPLLKTNSCPGLAKNCLGADLTSPEDEMGNLRAGWRTPSPTAMGMISEEAFRIADQLETLETSIWDEEFPSEDECFEDFSNKVKISHNLSSELDHKSLSHKVNRVEENIIIDHELKAKCLSNNKEGLSFKKENRNSSSRNECSKFGESSVIEVNVIDKSNGSDATKENCKIAVNILGTAAEALCKTVENGSGEPMKEASENCTEDEAGRPTEDIYGEETKVSGKPKENLLNKASVKTEKEISEKPGIEMSCVKEGFWTNATQVSSIEAGEVSNRIKDICETEEINIVLNFTTVTKTASSPINVDSGGVEEAFAIEESSAMSKNQLFQNEENKILVEENLFMLEEINGSIEKHINGNTCVKAMVEKAVNVESNCLATGKNLMDRESITLKIENSNQTEKDSNVIESEGMEIFENDGSVSIADTEQMHVSSEDNFEVNNNKSTPSKFSSMKSKIIKACHTIKTPNKSNKEKENIIQGGKDKKILSAKKNSKVGQVSSAKSALGELNVNRSEIFKGSSNITTPLTKRILGKIPFGKGENKSNKSMAQDLSQNTPLKNSISLKFQAATPVKTPLCKSYSMISNSKTPNMANGVRRSNSFQTNCAKNLIPMKREKTFAAQSQIKTLNSSILSKTTRIGNEFKTPSKPGSFLPKASTNAFATPFSSNTKSNAKVSHIARPSFGSALKQINVPIESSPQIVGVKRPATTTSKTRFSKKLEMPSKLPDHINDSLSRQLFPDKTPKKRFN